MEGKASEYDLLQILESTTLEGMYKELSKFKFKEPHTLLIIKILELIIEENK